MKKGYQKINISLGIKGDSTELVEGKIIDIEGIKCFLHVDSKSTYKFYVCSEYKTGVKLAGSGCATQKSAIEMARAKIIQAGIKQVESLLRAYPTING